MKLTGLPTELLDEIIIHVMPEGFESMALTCSEIYTLCVPFIERHNKLRSQFRDFHYYGYHQKFMDTRTAFDLIKRIAIEPVVARFIRHANFSYDGRLPYDRITRRNPRAMESNAHCDEAMIRLLANSSYLEEAGLDWKVFRTELESELQFSYYSQLAAAFLLTLLPNVESFTLPSKWKPLEATDKLIDTVVRKARQSHPLSDRPSLAQVTRLQISISLVPDPQFDLDWANPFLALPCVRYFCGPGCVAMDDGRERISTKQLYRGFGETLEAVHFMSCFIDEVAIASFLEHTPRLRTLTYAHRKPKDRDPQCWDICKFVTGIEREAGSHLVELSISIWGLQTPIASSKASMRGFQRLQKLELPLDVAVCNVAYAASRAASPNEPLIGGSPDHELDYREPFIGDLVPASVSRLLLKSSGVDYHGEALDIMFRQFVAKKDSQMPALKDIHLSCFAQADDAYKAQCAKLLAQVEEAGVVLHLEDMWTMEETTWDDL